MDQVGEGQVFTYSLLQNSRRQFRAVVTQEIFDKCRESNVTFSRANIIDPRERSQEP